MDCISICVTLKETSCPAFLSALWELLSVLTEPNCEGNNEDGQTNGNTTSYQRHLLDGGEQEDKVSDSDNDSVHVRKSESE